MKKNYGHQKSGIGYHYRKKLNRWIWEWADGANFFVHKNGKTDPKSELLALLNFLNIGAVDKNHPLCKFLAELKWLQKGNLGSYLSLISVKIFKII